MTAPPDPPNLNYAWCGLLVEELVRQGVAGFVLSPGSRSAPLAISVARNERARHWMHFDERGAAFFALGLAKASGKPAVLICTSGSAAANYWPAVVEAAMDRVPLILLTADRPPELVDCGANQAIDQTHLYGRYTRWDAALPCPDAAIDPAYVLTTADQAWRRSQHPLAGPVHLNCPFREPLAPDRDASMPRDYLESLAAWAAGGTPYTRAALDEAPLPNTYQPDLLDRIRRCERGLLAIGGLRGAEEIEAAAALARALGWPVFADVCASLRGLPDIPALVRHGDLVLLDDTLTDAWRPDLVLHVGGPVTSKRYQAFVERVRPEYIRVCAGTARRDPGHLVSMQVDMAPARFCAWLAADMAGSPQAGVPAALRKRDNQCGRQLDAWEDANDVLSEIGVARAIAEQAPAGSLVFLGNSMPVRLMDGFGQPITPDVWMAANRGASGIDGNVATAAGMAVASGRPTTVLAGDLAVLHDLNSLAFLRQTGVPFALVVLNNDGGGIFHHLPIAHYPDVFEACFGTPHGLTFAASATQFDIPYQHPADMAEFTRAYRNAMDTPGPTLIEVAVDRESSLTGHRALVDALRNAMQSGQESSAP